MRSLARAELGELQSVGRVGTGAGARVERHVLVVRCRRRGVGADPQRIGTRQRRGHVRRARLHRPASQRDHQRRRTEVQHHPVGRLHLCDQSDVSRRPPVGGQRGDCHHHDGGLPVDGLEQRSMAHAVAGIRDRTSIRLGDGRGDVRQVADRHGGRRGARLSPSTSRRAAPTACSPPTASVGAGGGTVTVSITANPECEWSATSNDAWITIQGRSSGTGSGTVTFAAAATTGPSRSGSAVVAGQTIAISQTPGCSFAISPESASVPAAAATGKVAVTTERRLQLDGVEQRFVADHHGGIERQRQRRSAVQRVGGDGSRPQRHADHRRPHLHAQPGRRLRVLAFIDQHEHR